MSTATAVLSDQADKGTHCAYSGETAERGKMKAFVLIHIAMMPV